VKVVIDQDQFIEAIKRGAAAALSDEAQLDSSNVSRLVQAVKMTADSSTITVESTTKLISSRAKIKVGNGITVKEEGAIAVPAKQFFDWLDKQKGAHIGIELKKLDTPEIIRDADIQEQGGDTHGIRKIGNVSLLAKGAVAAKWQLDCYDPERMPSVDFSDKPASSFTMSAKELANGLAHTEIAIRDKDLEHVLDSIIFETSDEKVYMAATDTVRCALFRVSSAHNVNPELFPVPEDEQVAELVGRKIMVPCSLLKAISKLIGQEGEISFHYVEGKDRVFISNSKSEYRVVTTNEQGMAKVPSITRLLKSDFKKLCMVSKKNLATVLAIVSGVNQESAQFTFVKDKVMARAKSERSGLEPSDAATEVDGLSQQFKTVWNIKHLFAVIKIITDDSIEMSIPSTNNLLLRVTDPSDKNFSYYSRAIQNPIYDEEDD